MSVRRLYYLSVKNGMAVRKKPLCFLRHTISIYIGIVELYTLEHKIIISDILSIQFFFTESISIEMFLTVFIDNKILRYVNKLLDNRIGVKEFDIFTVR